MTHFWLFQYVEEQLDSFRLLDGKVLRTSLGCEDGMGCFSEQPPVFSWNARLRFVKYVSAATWMAITHTVTRHNHVHTAGNNISHVAGRSVDGGATTLIHEFFNGASPGKNNSSSGAELELHK